MAARGWGTERGPSVSLGDRESWEGGGDGHTTRSVLKNG